MKTFKNPFKQLSKNDFGFVLLLLLLAIANRLLIPYREPLESFFAAWMPVLYVLFFAALLNIVAFAITTMLKEDKREEWWEGRQPQPAWKEKALHVWMVSLLVAVVILCLGILVTLLFSRSLSVFVIYLLVYFLGKFFPNLGNITWRRKRA